MLQEITVALSDRRWAEALNYAGDVPSICVALSLEDGSSPYEKYNGRKPVLEHLESFGFIGCAHLKGNKSSQTVTERRAVHYAGNRPQPHEQYWKQAKL